MRNSTEWEDAFDQLTRYGGEPHTSVVPLLTILANLNDDLCHMRHRDVIAASVTDAKTALDRLLL